MSGTDGVEQMVAAVRAAHAQTPEPRSATRRVGMVEPAGDDERGWYRVVGRVSPSDLEYLGEGQLAHGSGPGAVTYDVVEVAVDGEQVRVRASVTAPRERLTLTVPSAGHRRVLQGLLDGLQKSRSNSLLTGFCDSRLTPVTRDRQSTQAHGWQSLRPAQRDAVAACCSPGLQLVWGPPGTGKTHVIASAISQLAATGKRVLLVSHTNIAVDTALHQALRIMGPVDPGTAVRVGNIHLPALADNDRIRLDRLVGARQATLRARVDRLAAELEQLADAGTRLAQVQERLAGFDADSFRRAAERVSNRQAYDRVRTELGPAETELGQARARLHDAERLRLSLTCQEAAAQEQEIRGDLATVESALAEYLGSSFLVRARHPTTASRLTANRTRLVDELTRASARRRDAVDAARRAGADPALAQVLTAEQVSAATGEARRRLDVATQRMTDLRRQAERLMRSGLSTPSDEDLVTAERDRWQLHESLPALREATRQADRRRNDVQREYERTLKQLRGQRREIENEVVSGAHVVATTLTQLTLRTCLTAVPYDHVIVDEAAAAWLPHLAHAVGYATTGAVLVGDYLQNGPFIGDSFHADDAVKAVFETDCFSHFRATDPQQADQLPGCVVLTEQFRFGPVLTELANRVAYRGVLTTATPAQADIVVVTTDGLPEDVSAIHTAPGKKQAGWWLIGALLARALAEHHNDCGAADAFGVVVPYRAQVQATQAALDDSSLALLTPVGTSHQFQGRQFDTVLADLVENGHGMFNGTRSDVGSLRVFNVAATRPRSRLYVLVGRGPLERARQGPLAAVRHMVTTGHAHLIDAGVLIGTVHTDTPSPDTPEADLLAALAPYVRVSDLHDEDATIDEVISRIDAARHDVWCWSAWVGRHAEGIIDALDRAQRRNVTVHVLARPEREVQDANRDALRRLTARIPHVVFIQKMHQKIVVVDRRWSIVGSMNVLSHGPTSSRRFRDIMVTMEGASFAEQLLHHELADELAQRRTCPSCRQPLVECALSGTGQQRGWAWVCQPPCSAGNGRRVPFPTAPTTPTSPPGHRRNTSAKM